MAAMGQVVDLLSRPVYGMSQVDRLLGLYAGTARRWIDGYSRAGRSYPPVVRERRTGEDIATWGEFVETRLLSEYRDAGVPMLRMRPVVERLREELNTPYPLASARTWLIPNGRELVERVQGEVDHDRHLALVEPRTGQGLFWTVQAENFTRSVDWSTNDEFATPVTMRPVADIAEVVIDPLRGFGEPVVRGVRTEIIAELFTAGDPAEMIAELYELPPSSISQAIRYELTRERLAS